MLINDQVVRVGVAEPTRFQLAGQARYPAKGLSKNGHGFTTDDLGKT